MARLLGREAVLILMAGLFSAYLFPLLIGEAATPGLFLVGLLISLSFVALYVIGVAVVTRLKPRTRAWVAAVVWLLAFGPDLYRLAGLLQRGTALGGAGLYRELGPPVLLTLLVAAAGAARRTEGSARGAGALTAMAHYGFTMAGVRWLLVPLVGENLLAAAMVMQTGAVYAALRAVTGGLWPIGRAEGEAGAPPLVRKGLPDRVVGVLESTTGLRARPFATRADGTADDAAISVVAPADRAEALARAVQAALAADFAVTVGVAVEGGTEVVVKRSSQS